MLLHQPVQVEVHRCRVFVDEVEALGLGLLAVDSLFRVEDQGHVLIAAADLTQQLQTGLRVALLHMRETSLVRVHRETGVADHAERVLMILLVDGHRLLIVCGEHHLRTSALALGSGVGVECLGREALRLCEDIII